MKKNKFTKWISLVVSICILVSSVRVQSVYASEAEAEFAVDKGIIECGATSDVEVQRESSIDTTMEAAEFPSGTCKDDLMLSMTVEERDFTVSTSGNVRMTENTGSQLRADPMSLLMSGSVTASSGKCGENIDWILDSEGRLLITGNGEMYSYTNYPDLDSSYSPFYGREDIESVVFSGEITRIGDLMFYGCKNIKTVSFPKALRTIGIQAFRDCTGLKSIALPEGMVDTGDGGSFVGCTGIESFYIPHSVIKISYDTFWGCIGLRNIELPKLLEKIDFNAFSVTSLETVSVPESVREIGFGVFQQCDNLKTIKLSPNVTVIRKATFSDCSSLKEIEIPYGVGIIETMAFSGCSGLSDLVIPESVTTIEDRVFDSCKNIEIIRLPNSVKTIGDRLFWECDNLRIVTLPNDIKEIPVWCFYGCDSLEKIIIPEKTEKIGKRAFSGVHLKEIYIPKSVEVIEENAIEYWVSNLIVYYYGTEEDWGKVSKPDELLGIKVIYNSSAPGGNDSCFIKATSGEGGLINPSGNINVPKGENRVFKFIPNEGFKIRELFIDDVRQDIVGDSYTFNDVQNDHSIRVEFKRISEDNYKRIQEGAIVSTEDLYDEYSFYIATNYGFEDKTSKIINEMSNVLQKKESNIWTAIRYNCEHVGDTLWWIASYFDGGAKQKLKEREIIDEISQELMLGISNYKEAESEAAVDKAKKRFKPADKLQKAIVLNCKEQLDAELESSELIQQIYDAHGGKYTKIEIQEFLTGGARESLDGVKNSFKALKITFSAIDAVFFHLYGEVINRVATETLLENISPDSQLYIGLRDLKDRQDYKGVAFAESIQKFIEPFAQSWLEDKLGFDEGITHASEMAAKLLKRMGCDVADSFTVSPGALALGKVSFWIGGKALGLFGVPDLDDKLKAMYSFDNLMVIDNSLKKHRSAIWNYGKLKDGNNAEENKQTDEFLFMARNVAIDEAYKNLCKIYGKKDTENLTKIYDQYRKELKYDLFVKSCKEEAKLGFNTREILYGRMGAYLEPSNSIEYPALRDAQSDYGLSIYSADSADGIMPVSLNIPEKLGDVDIIGIEKAVFSGSETIERVNLPDSMLSLGEDVFSDCKNIKEVILGRNLEEIGSGAFRGCVCLETIDMPVTVKTIADDAFDGIPKLVFVGEAGSYAEDYANRHDNISFMTREKKVQAILDVKSTQEEVPMSCDIDMSAVTIEVLYDDGTTGSVTDGIYCEFENKQIGRNRVIVCYGGCLSEYYVDVIADDCNYTVTYINHNHDEIAPGVTGSAIAGTNLTLEAPHVDGYVVDEKTRNVTIGEKNEFYVTYTSDRELTLMDDPVPVANIMVSPTSFDLAVGQTRDIMIYLYPEKATDTRVTWKSSDESIAKVSDEGKVTAISTGMAIITVTTLDGGKTASCAAVVRKARPEQDPNMTSIWFESYGGSYVPCITVAKGAVPQRPADPERDGYTFDGWYEDEDYAGKIFDFTKAVDADNICLYAKWSIKGLAEEAPVDPDAVCIMVVKEKRDLSDSFNRAYGKYTVTPKNAASITKKALLTAKKPGIVTVVGYVKEGKSWVEAERVKVQIVKPYFVQKRIEGRFDGQNLRLYDYLVDHSALSPTYVTSSKSLVAELGGTGKNRTFRICEKGTTKITVQYGTGKNAAKYNITLKATFPVLSKTDLKLQTGASAALKLKNTKLQPSWDTEGLTRMENGKLTALYAGQDVVTASLDGVEYVCRVEIVRPEIKKDSMAIKVGKRGSVGLKKTKLKNIEWVSEDPDIATVDGKGRVTGIKAGTTVISTFAGGVENTCRVTVK